MNPDPARIDGVLLPLQSKPSPRPPLQDSPLLRGQAKFREVTLAQATLDDGQRLLAFNELFIGSHSHVSARYRLEIGGRSESQSSSGILVCTGAGSSGWLSSVFKMAGGLASVFQADRSAPKSPIVDALRIKWEDPRLVFVVREPFVSRTSSANIVAGIVEPAKEDHHRVQHARRWRHFQRRRRSRFSAIQFRCHRAHYRRTKQSKAGCAVTTLAYAAWIAIS